mgnify:FL=1
MSNLLEKTNVLRGKNTFTVKDFVEVLSKLNPESEVSFGVIEDDCTSFSQDDDLIFNLNQNNREHEFMGEYVVEILTDNRNKF